MGLSVLQSIKVGAYVMKHRLKGTPRFPLVLMLEPLFRCNLECAGCGKIQFPEETLKKHLNSPPRNPKDLNPDLDDDLVEILLKCIERDRDLRFSSVRAFKEALKKLDRQDY